MRAKQGRGSGLIFMIVFILLALLLILWLLNREGREDELPFPTLRPSPTSEPFSATPNPSATPSASPSPSATASATPSATATASPSPSGTPNSTPLPDFPPQPPPVDLIIAEGVLGGIPPNIGQYGGLYDNARLTRAGHIMIRVPADAAQETFYIDAFEVTNIQLVNYLNLTNLTDIPLTGWAVDANGGWIGAAGPLRQAFDGDWEARNQRFMPLPAHGISALTARAYCANLGGTLPTLDQWRRAAFGSETGAERPYPWGDAPPDRSYANFAGEAPLVRDSFPNRRSWVGAFNMAGNVAEWVQLDETRFGYIGGSFLDDALAFPHALTTLEISNPSDAPSGVGFRCVRAAE